jgi:DNA-directed RNA polymerase omega subunit
MKLKPTPLRSLFRAIREGQIQTLTLATEKTSVRKLWVDKGNECWPGIVSRFQLVILAGRRSRQLFNGSQARIPADPLKKRNTSIALEELRQGLIPFIGQNGNEPQTVLASNDLTVNTTVAEHGPDFDLLEAG